MMRSSEQAASADPDDAERQYWFRHIVMPLRPKLLAHVRRIIGDDSESEDLVHEALVKVMTITEWRRVSSPLAFLKVVARNRMFDDARHRRMVSFQLHADMGRLGCMDGTADPLLSCSGQEEIRILAQLIAALPPMCQRVFLLRRIQGMAPTDIAMELGLSLSTVEKHLRRAQRYCAEGLFRRGIVRSDNVPYGAGQGS